MLMPKRVKRRKQFRGSMKGKALRGNKINYGFRCCINNSEQDFYIHYRL